MTQTEQPARTAPAAGTLLSPPGAEEPSLSARAIAGRLSWGLADQAVSSMTNFAVGIFVASSLGVTDFGIFSLAWVTYSVVLNMSRGLATDPLVVRFSGVPTAQWRKAVGRSSGTALGVGCIAAAVSLLAGLAIGGGVGAGFVALGLVLPLLMLQDSWRYAFFAAGHGRKAFLNDLVWAAALVPAMMLAAQHGSVFAYVLAWGLSGGVAALYGCMQTGMLPRFTGVLGWLRQQRDLGGRYMVENVSMSGAAMLRMYGLGAIAGLADVGAVRGAELMLGPFYMVLMGLCLVSVPEAARVLKRSPQRLSRFCLVLGVGQAAGALVWGLGLMLLLPDSAGQWLLGSVWLTASTLILPATLAFTNVSFSTGAAAGLRALGASRRSLRAQLLGATAYATCGLVGAALGGALGSAWGVALATAFAAAVSWTQLHAGLREYSPTAAEEDTAVPAVRVPEGEDGVKSAPRLSIGLPVYNGEEYLTEALDALLGQTYTDYELIISDNASTDATEAICRRYAAADPRIRYIRLPRNIGAAPNHNFVFQQARGELFKWASHDDLYARDLLRRCIEVLDERPDVVLSHSFEAIIDGSGRAVETFDYRLATDSAAAPERFKSLLYAPAGDDFYGVIRADVLRKVAPHDSYHHADRTIVAEIVLHGQFHQVPEILYFRRDHPTRAERANPTVRSRCGNLDPRRLQHSTLRLFWDYVRGWIGVVHRAPLTTARRWGCYRSLVGYLVTRLLPRSGDLDDGLRPVRAPGEVPVVDAVVAGREVRSA